MGQKRCMRCGSVAEALVGVLTPDGHYCKPCAAQLRGLALWKVRQQMRAVRLDKAHNDDRCRHPGERPAAPKATQPK